jgi:hypothetical protein
MKHRKGEKYALTQKHCGRLVLAVCVLLSAGCGSGRPPTAFVNGRVTYQGSPVVEGTIVFQPEYGRPAMSLLAPDGSYALRTFDLCDGALLGRHRVTIEARRISVTRVPGGAAGESVGAYGPPKVEWLVPEIYSRLETTPLTAEVKPGNNAIDFKLP